MSTDKIKAVTDTLTRAGFTRDRRGHYVHTTGGQRVCVEVWQGANGVVIDAFGTAMQIGRGAIAADGVSAATVVARLQGAIHAGGATPADRRAHGVTDAVWRACCEATRAALDALDAAEVAQ